jgi:hypothetical protein
VKGFIIRLCAALVLFATLTLMGCEVNKGAFDGCQPGMTKQEVKSLMAMKPWLESKDTLVYMGDNVEKVQFDFDENGKLKNKEWREKIKF